MAYILTVIVFWATHSSKINSVLQVYGNMTALFDRVFHINYNIICVCNVHLL